MAREERETMSILFFIKKTKLLKNGEAPICLRLTLNKQIAEIRIKRSILVNRWSPAKGCALGKDRVAKELNSYLEAIRLKIHQIHRELVLDMSAPVTANAIMNRYCGNDVKMLLEVFEDHNDKCRALIGKEYVEGTVRKFDTTLLYLKQFLKQRYRKDDIPLPEINQEFVRDFEFFLKTEKSCQNNSALKHIKNFRKVIRIAIGNDWIKRDPFFGLRFKAEEVNVDFLSNDELKRIRQKKITIPRLERIRDIFVFCCFTGLAFVDVSQLTAEDLIAIGIYTSMLHNTVNSRKPENLMRSAKAPKIRAGVIIANMHWNRTNISSGMLPAERLPVVMPFSRTLSNPPIRNPQRLPLSIRSVPKTKL